MTKHTLNDYRQADYSEFITSMEPMLEIRNRYIEAISELDSVYTDLNEFIDSIIEQLPSDSHYTIMTHKFKKQVFFDRIQDAKREIAETDKEREFINNN